MTRTYRWTPEGLARRRAALARPEVRAKMAAAARETWARPEVRAKMAAALARPEVRAKRAAAVAARALPLSQHQRRIYNKLRGCGIDRERALAEALKTVDRREAVEAAA